MGRRREVGPWRAGLIALVVVLLAAACSSDDGGDDTGTGAPGDTTPQGEVATQRNQAVIDAEADLTPVDGGTLRFAVEGESDGYNPIYNRWSISGNLIGSAVYEALTTVTADRTVEPWLAESVEPNDDGTVWTVVAREGVSFHDGTPFDAEVIAANIEARREGVLTSQANLPLENVEVVDEMTVEVTMSEPWAQWDQALASQSGYMISPTNIADPAADPVGTGPFRWVEHVQDSQVVVERNADYWREAVPHLDRIEFPIIVEEQGREQALAAGDVDAILTQSPSTIVQYRDAEDHTLVEDGASDTHVVMLNTAAAPFDDPLARELIAAASDPGAIVEGTYEGIVEVAEGPFPSESVWSVDDSGWTGHDPDRAAELAQQYEDENGGPLQVELKGNQSDETKALMELLVAQWAEVGIEGSIEQVEQSTYIGEVVVGDYQAGMFRNFSWADPDFNYLFWHSSTDKGIGEVSINFTHSSSDELDAALETGRSSFDEVERQEAYAEVVRQLNADLSYVWLFHSLWGIVSEPDVHGWTEAAERGFSRQDAKIWWGDLWIEQ